MALRLSKPIAAAVMARRCFMEAPPKLVRS